MRVRIYGEPLRLSFGYSKLSDGRRTTVAMLWAGEKSDSEPLFIGSAICSPTDRFERRIGRKVALAHALKAFPRPERAKIWAQYFSLTGLTN